MVVKEKSVYGSYRKSFIRTQEKIRRMAFRTDSVGNMRILPVDRRLKC